MRGRGSIARFHSLSRTGVTWLVLAAFAAPALRAQQPRPPSASQALPSHVQSAAALDEYLTGEAARVIHASRAASVGSDRSSMAADPSGIAPVTGQRGTAPAPDPLVDPSGNAISETTVKGLVLTRDIVAGQFDAFADGLAGLQDAPRAEKVDTARGLLDESATLRDSYVRMVQAEARASDLYNEQRSYYENTKREAADLRSRGFTARADELDAYADNSNWGQYLKRQQEYADLLSKNPMLGIEVDGVPLWKALFDLGFETSAGQYRNLTPIERDQLFVDLLNTYLRSGIDQMRAIAQRIRGLTKVSELWGLTQFRGAVEAAAAIGQELGSNIAAPLVDAAQAVATGAAITKAENDAFWNAIVESSLGAAQAIAMLLPGGVFISIGIGIIQASRAGKGYAVAIKEEERAREEAPVAGEDRAQDARRKTGDAREAFGLSVVGLLTDVAGAALIPTGPARPGQPGWRAEVPDAPPPVRPQTGGAGASGSPAASAPATPGPTERLPAPDLPPSAPPSRPRTGGDVAPAPSGGTPSAPPPATEKLPAPDLPPSGPPSRPQTGGSAPPATAAEPAAPGAPPVTEKLPPPDLPPSAAPSRPQTGGSRSAGEVTERLPEPDVPPPPPDENATTMLNPGRPRTGGTAATTPPGTAAQPGPPVTQKLPPPDLPPSAAPSRPQTGGARSAGEATERLPEPDIPPPAPDENATTMLNPGRPRTGDSLSGGPTGTERRSGAPASNAGDPPAARPGTGGTERLPEPDLPPSAPRTGDPNFPPGSQGYLTDEILLFRSQQELKSGQQLHWTEGELERLRELTNDPSKFVDRMGRSRALTPDELAALRSADTAERGAVTQAVPNPGGITPRPQTGDAMPGAGSETPVLGQNGTRVQPAPDLPPASTRTQTGGATERLGDPDLPPAAVDEGTPTVRDTNRGSAPSPAADRSAPTLRDDVPTVRDRPETGGNRPPRRPEDLMDVGEYDPMEDVLETFNEERALAEQVLGRDRVTEMLRGVDLDDHDAVARATWAMTRERAAAEGIDITTVPMVRTPGGGYVRATTGAEAAEAALAEFDRLGAIHSRALTGGLTDADIDWLTARLREDPNYFDNLSKRGYVLQDSDGNPLDDVQFMLREDEAASLRAAYEARTGASRPQTGAAAANNPPGRGAPAGAAANRAGAAPSGEAADAPRPPAPVPPPTGGARPQTGGDAAAPDNAAERNARAAMDGITKIPNPQSAEDAARRDEPDRAAPIAPPSAPGAPRTATGGGSAPAGAAAAGGEDTTVGFVPGGAASHDLTETGVPPIDFTIEEGPDDLADANEYLSVPSFIDLVDNPGYVAFFGGGGRSGAVQIMMIEIPPLRVPALSSRVGRRAEPPGERRAGLANLWSLFRHPRSLAIHAGWRRPAPRAFASRGGQRGGQAGRPPEVRMFLSSLGVSTGEAFELQVLNEGRDAVDLAGDGVVVEPLDAGAQARGRSEFQQVATKASAAARVSGYCLEFLRQPPSAGMLFRIASPQLQQQFAPMRKILQAARKLEQAGLLRPDSTPLDYFHSIRQWAIWAKEQKFDVKSFGRAFVEHAKKNFTAAGRQWSKPIEDAVLGLVPGRWNDIVQVLKTASEAERTPAPVEGR